jgi:hypothetical protein
VYDRFRARLVEVVFDLCYFVGHIHFTALEKAEVAASRAAARPRKNRIEMPNLLR